MSTQPNQGQDSNQPYGGYSGYSSSQQGNTQDDQQSGYQPYEGYYQQQQQPGSQGQQQQQSSQGQQQQQTFYQPPQSAMSQSQSATSASDGTSLGWDAKLEALLSYLLWFVGGAFFLGFERKNRFVRFHAAQSFVFMGGTFVFWALFQLITHIWVIGPLLGFVLGFPVSIIMGIVGIIWIFLMIMAYRGTTFRLPIVADYADAL